MAKRVLAAILPFFFSLAPTLLPAVAAEPGYPAGHIGSTELNQFFDLAYLIDCRSRLEYDILHMKNAAHIPEGTMVRDDLERLRIKDPTKAIVFYGNGEDCPQSRAAFEKAGKLGYENIFVYRPGILRWAKERPERVLFLGAIPGLDSQRRLFATGHYLEKCLPPSQFVASTHQPGTMVVDIRAMAERESFSITLPNLQYYSVDRLVKLIKSGSRKVTGKKMFILDSCGGQSQWLQYILDDNGIDHAFLKGGVAAWRQAGLDRFGNHEIGAGQ